MRPLGRPGSRDQLADHIRTDRIRQGQGRQQLLFSRSIRLRSYPSRPAAHEFLYETTNYWYPEFERTLLWNDPAVGIDWPIGFMPRMADKDAAGRLLSELETFA
ncbi:dTDP-4-dehydrorhamnose 3,5-epimerase family protein [Telluria sp. B2]